MDSLIHDKQTALLRIDNAAIDSTDYTIDIL